MAFYCYILRCSDGSYYTGHTDNLDHRIAQHQTGEIPCYTHSRRPVELAWAQDFPTRHEALTAEHQIKGRSRTKKTALIVSDWTRLKEAAIPRAERALRLRSGRTEE